MKGIRCGILGSGNIGTDLMYKLLRSELLELAIVAGVEPQSEGLARARAEGLATTTEGIEGLLAFQPTVAIVFDATSAKAHRAHAQRLEAAGITTIDLTPAAVGQYVIPTVNLRDHLGAANVNMVSCGGQATIPIVAAVSRVANVEYAEIVATIASCSAGPGTRQNIDEFTETTARAIEQLGGARRGKAIIVMNPAEPPILMRDTVHVQFEAGASREAIAASIWQMIDEVKSYVPGYRSRTEPIFDGDRVTIVLEVEGAGDFLPKYSGNLDIMTAAAVRVGEEFARALLPEHGVAKSAGTA